MTDLGSWFDARRPPPPSDLRGHLAAGGGLGDGDVVGSLTNEAVCGLNRARAATGRVRQSALDLLVADALFTYACEAALELPDPDAALRRIVRMAADAG